MGSAVTSMKTPPVLRLRKGEKVCYDFEIDLDRLAPGGYTTKLVLSVPDNMGHIRYLDVLMESYGFEIKQAEDFMHNHQWSIPNNGFLTGNAVKIL